MYEVIKSIFLLARYVPSTQGPHPTTSFSEAKKVGIRDWFPPFLQESYWTIQDMISCSCCLLHAFLNKKKNQKKGKETHPITTFMHIHTPWTFPLRVSTWVAVSSSSCKRSLYERFFSRCILPGASPSSTLRWLSRDSDLWEMGKNEEMKYHIKEQQTSGPVWHRVMHKTQQAQRPER